MLVRDESCAVSEFFVRKEFLYNNFHLQWLTTYTCTFLQVSSES